MHSRQYGEAPLQQPGVVVKTGLRCATSGTGEVGDGISLTFWDGESECIYCAPIHVWLEMAKDVILSWLKVRDKLNGVATFVARACRRACKPQIEQVILLQS